MAWKDELRWERVGWIREESLGRAGFANLPSNLARTLDCVVCCILRKINAVSLGSVRLKNYHQDTYVCGFRILMLILLIFVYPSFTMSGTN